MQPDSALTRECFETGAVVVCDDTDNDDRVRRVTANILRLRSAVVVPIQFPAQTEAVEVLGLIEILSSRPYAFDTTHVVGLKSIAEMLAPVLAAAQPAEPELAEPGEDVLAPIAVAVQDETPKSRGLVFLIASAVLLLLLLLVPAYLLFKSSKDSPSAPSSNSYRAGSARGGTGRSAAREIARIQTNLLHRRLPQPHRLRLFLLHHLDLSQIRKPKMARLRIRQTRNHQRLLCRIRRHLPKLSLKVGLC